MRPSDQAVGIVLVSEGGIEHVLAASVRRMRVHAIDHSCDSRSSASWLTPPCAVKKFLCANHLRPPPGSIREEGAATGARDVRQVGTVLSIGRGRAAPPRVEPATPTWPSGSDPPAVLRRRDPEIPRQVHVVPFGHAGTQVSSKYTSAVRRICASRFEMALWLA